MSACDVAVIGAGPAGIAAAVRAQQSGARVVVVDDNPSAGGQIWRGGQQTDWLTKFRNLGQIATYNARVVSGDAHPLKLVVETADGTQVIRPTNLILATGAREIFLPFPGWTLPGVMGVGGLQAMAKSGLPIQGKKIVVAGSGPLLLAVAAYLKSHGARVKLIAEQASRRAVAGFAMQLLWSPGKLAQAARLQGSLLGVRYLQNCWVTEAHGDGRLQSVTLRHGTKTWTEESDYAAVAYGLYPNTELASLQGCELTGTAVRVDELQKTSVANVYCAGECTGIGGVDLAIVEGEIAGYAATGQTAATRLFGRRRQAQAFADALNKAFALRSELRSLARPDTLVCRCEDVTYKRLESVPGFRAAKLHTRCGMGPCQGRVCGPACDFLFGWRTESIRPPVFPARLGTLHFRCKEQEEIVKQE